jgi:RNA polymerase sigma-70 factor (ECF subfamily)
MENRIILPFSFCDIFQTSTVYVCQIRRTEGAALLTERDSSAKVATEQLFEQYGNEIRKYARYMLGSWNEADDATQEIFLRVFKSWHQYGGQSAVRTWLWAIARNHIKDLLRARKKAYQHTSPIPVEDHPMVHEMSTVEIEVAETLEKLRESQRQAIILRYFEDMSVADTAVILGWSQGKVRTVTHRALKRLQFLLSEGSNLQMGSGGDGCEV